jgi:hypothetical protein
MKHSFLLSLAILISLQLLINNSFYSQCPNDINGNGIVDGDDLLELLSTYGMSCEGIPTYEPSISEIHYNPSTQQGTDSEWEFVELYNNNPFGIDLSEWSLAEAVNALIPLNTWLNAGEYIVFANDITSSTSIYISTSFYR